MADAQPQRAADAQPQRAADAQPQRAADTAKAKRGDVFDYDRTVALSDGVFAIALTLLVLNIPQPSSSGDLWGELGELIPDLAAYALSFVVIATMWRVHHIFCRGLDRIDAKLTTLNLAFLGLIALIPFPTGLIAERGDESPAVIVYAATIAAVTAMFAAMELYAERTGLTEPRDRPLIDYILVPAVFLISIPIAVVSPAIAAYSWISLLFLGRYLNRRDRRKVAG